MCARAKNKRFLRASRCQPGYYPARLADIYPVGMPAPAKLNKTRTDWQENRFSGIYCKCRALFCRGFAWVC
jgi:hypothetical protein